MPYDIEIAPAAVRELKKLKKKVSSTDWRAISNAIDSIGKEPRPSNAEKLSDSDALYRVRAGNFRVIYQVQDKALIVVVVKVADRKDAYKEILKVAKARLKGR